MGIFKVLFLVLEGIISVKGGGTGERRYGK